MSGNTSKPTPPESADEAVANAPEPSAKGTGKKVVRVMYPNDRFVVEDCPVITAEGVELTSEQVKRAVASARLHDNVRLVDVDGKPVDDEETK